MNSSTKVIVGLAVAAAAGAALGMLLTNQSGPEFQKKIKFRASEWLNEFSSLLNTGKEIISQFSAKPLGESRTSEFAEIETRTRNGNYGQ